MGTRLKDISPAKVKDLIAKYHRQTFHYTEYPHKSFWGESFSEDDFKTALKSINPKKNDISQMLFVNVPFCKKQCLFCICHTFITQDYARVKRYLDSLFLEIDLLQRAIIESGIAPKFEEIHLGGGSPTMLDLADFDGVVEKIQSVVDFRKLKRFSMEIDPRNTDASKLCHYSKKGVTRLSFGIQDFDPAVQKAINRVQPPDLLKELLVPEVRSNFEGINFDILCGMPRQTRQSFEQTMNTTIGFSPDRIMLMYLTYSPQLKRHHQLMKTTEFPDPYEKLILFDEAMHSLLDAGYLRIGMDHFARSSDDLGVSLTNKTVHWNSLGYRPGFCRDMIGVGSGSSGMVVPEFYFQNVYDVESYSNFVKQGHFPILRGYRLSKDDIIRREVIHMLRIYFELKYSDIETSFQIDFKKYFRSELQCLKELAKDGLLDIGEDGIKVSDIGTHFVLSACRIFDNYDKASKQ